MQETFTTGEVAKLLHVAPRTCTKWIDSGALQGWRIPGSKQRRVHASAIVRFAREHGMPCPACLEQQLLLVGLPLALAAAWPEATVAASLVEAAFLINPEASRHCIVLDAVLGRSDCQRAGKAIRQRLPQARLLALASEDEVLSLQWLEHGFSTVLLPPVTVDMLKKEIEQ